MDRSTSSRTRAASVLTAEIVHVNVSRYGDNNIGAMRRLLEYMYLDHRSIESLYAQAVESLETSRVTTVKRELSAKGRVGARFRNVLIKMLTGIEAEVSAEATGSATRIEQRTTSRAIEQTLNDVIEFLDKSGKGYYFTSLADAIRHVRARKEQAFLNIHETFNAPQFFGHASGVDRVNADRYLLFQRGGALDYDYSDNYYRQPTAVVKLSASVDKLRAGPVMGATSHEAVFRRGFGGRAVPLSVFGTLTDACEYFQIKPIAIWK